MLQYLPIILPIALGYISSLACGMSKSSGQNVKFRPPSIAFAIVWPILYIMLGVSWYISLQHESYKILINALYSLLVLLLSAWIIAYSCKNNKKVAVYILLISIMASLMTFSVGNTTSKLLLSPLIGWLIFATLMNTTEVQYE